MRSACVRAYQRSSASAAHRSGQSECSAQSRCAQLAVKTLRRDALGWAGRHWAALGRHKMSSARIEQEKFERESDGDVFRKRLHQALAACMRACALRGHSGRIRV
jgi:hypothetical protein